MKIHHQQRQGLLGSLVVTIKYCIEKPLINTERDDSRQRFSNAYRCKSGGAYALGEANKALNNDQANLLIKTIHL